MSPSRVASVQKSPLLFAREGFQRYAIRIQYNGGSFLGFAKQPHVEPQQQCLEDPAGGATDVRGVSSVQSRLERALSRLCGPDGFENVQVSSRTDRGVHAWNNTLHVDLKRTFTSDQQVVRGLNHYLKRSGGHSRESESAASEHGGSTYHPRHHHRRRQSNPCHDIQVLAATIAPTQIHQPYYQEGWSARFSATHRVYVYRLLHNCHSEGGGGAPLPFEWDRSWQIWNALDVEAMQLASQCLVGEHDFTSFRSKGCQRSSPIVTLRSIEVDTQPYQPFCLPPTNSLNPPIPLLTTIRIVGNAFLYRQMRHMIGCLVSVGLGKLTPLDVQGLLLEAHNHPSSTLRPYSTAPPHGLYLVHVQHGDFEW